MRTLYNSTRNHSIKTSSSDCILKGLSEDGGLFVTDDIDQITFDYNEFTGKGYRNIATKILSAFLSDFSAEQIDYCVNNAYNTENFESDEIFTLNTLDKFSFLELYRGKTIAFKDAALSILPHLMKCAKDNMHEKRKIVILTATSGDTGKAALEGFKNTDTDVIVFYPHNGVSKLQLLQMLTQEGENVFSIALEGNFDDAQNSVKEIFNDRQYNSKLNDMNVVLSSANSINIGRLIPQIVYYYYSYTKLIENGTIKSGDPINFVVPTGNFGNILAGYYAYKTGLPIHKLICSSNENHVLYDFFESGVYNKNREFVKTISPSMDILISSNLERLIYEMTGRDDVKLSALMESLKTTGTYSMDKNNPAFKLFYGGYATEDEIREAIKTLYEKYHYLIDTHTATGYKVYHDYAADTSDTTHTVILSTASPFKFSKDVLGAISDETHNDDVEYMYALSKRTGVKIPASVDHIEDRAAKKEIVINKEDMRNTIMQIIKR